MNNKYLYLIIVILIGCCLLQLGCEKETPEVKTDYSHLYKRIHDDSLTFITYKENAKKDSIASVKSKHREDSITKLKDKFVYLYGKASKTVYAQISEGICDTNTVKEAMHYCDSTIFEYKNLTIQKDSTIKHKDDEISDLKTQIQSSNDMNDAARLILKGQTDDNKALEKELKKVKRNNKIKTTLLIIGDVLKDALLIFALKK